MHSPARKLFAYYESSVFQILVKNKGIDGLYDLYQYRAA